MEQAKKAVKKTQKTKEEIDEEAKEQIEFYERRGKAIYLS